MNKLYFWKWNLGADTMIGRFDRDEMSSYEKFKLFFIVTLLTLLALETQYWFASEFQLEYTNIDKVESLLYMAISILGLIYLYKKHTEATSFIEKYFVVTIATIPVVIVLALIVSALFMMLSPLVTPEMSDAITWYDVVVSSVITVLYFWKIGTYFK